MKEVRGRNGGILKVPEKGETNNPKGKPKGTKNRSTIARQILEMAAILPQESYMFLSELVPGLSEKFTIEETMTLIQVAKAITDKDTQAYKALLDSAYGAPKQEIEHSGDEENPIKFTITKTYAPEPKAD